LSFFAIVIYGMWHGWFDELNGASPDTIKNVETVAYDPALFALPDQPDDGKPAPECCICTETFEEHKEIKRTTCQHYFHEECLGKWLRVSTTCPLCRNNLEKSVSGDSSPSGAQQQWSAAQPGGWAGLNFMDLPDAPASAHEAEEVRTLRSIFPDLDESTALLAIRQSGSAEQAAAILGMP
jgi:hypothetical protein